MIKKLKFRLLLLLLLEIYSLRLQAISLESTRYALMISTSLILAMHKSRICIPYVHIFDSERTLLKPVHFLSIPFQYVLAQRKIYFPIFHLLLLLNCWPGVLNDFSVIITTHQQRNVLNATNMQHTHTLMRQRFTFCINTSNICQLLLVERFP